MKVLILATLVASISAGWYESWKTSKDDQLGVTTHSRYESGKEYVYKFESQVLHSLPTFTKSHGGIKIISSVKIDFSSYTEAVLQMTECQVLSMNHEIGDPAQLPPREQLSTDQFMPLPSQQAALISSKLEMPIKFKYENGKITGIEVADKETNWSIDLKRSILSMLQVRLQADSTSSNPQLSYNDLSKENSTTFSFLEPALDGTCYSTVSVRREPYPAAEDNIYRIIKSRDPTNCPKPNSIYKVTWPQDIANCQCKPNMADKECTCMPTSQEYELANPAYFNAKTLSEYEVKSGDKENLIIKSCVQSATYRYEFPSSPDQYLATFSNQTLQLVQQKDEQSISTRAWSFKRISEPWRLQVLQDDEEQPMLTPEKLTEKAKKLIDEMDELSRDPARFKDHLTVFYQLVETLRLCKRDQLDRVWRQNEFGTQYKKWKVMVDALAHCNTTVCDEFLMDKMVADEEFPSKQSVTVFMLWASDKVPTLPILEKFKTTVLPALDGKAEKKMAYHHALMSFGSMVRRFIHSEQIKKSLCAWEKDKLIHQQRIDDCRKFEQVLEDKLTSARTDERKIAVLKALTNLGSLQSLPKLQKMLEKTESTAVRVHAVYAVKNLCFQNRFKVLQIITPLLTNAKEDSEVRTAAFYCYLMCNPSTAQLHRIIDSERDLDLKSFFVMTLRSELKRATAFPNQPDSLKRAQKAKMVLSKIRAFQMSPDSVNFETRFGLRPETDGDIIGWAWLANQTSPFPRAAAFHHSNVIRGVPRHGFEMGYRAEGFEGLFVKLADKQQSERAQSDISILDSLKPNSHRWTDSQIKPSLTLYFRVNGQQVSFIHFDADTILKHMLNSGSRGQVEIPVKVFQTYVMKPEQNKKLQPHGMWQVNERVDMGVLDIDGHLIVRKPVEGELMPNISFGSEKLFRHEKKTIISQYVRAGFAHSGVTSAFVTRKYIAESMWNVSYSLSHKNLTFNVSKPSQEIMMADMEAYTNTFFIPMELEEIVTEKSSAFKDVKTVDQDRQTFSKEIDAFKSVELKARIDADVSAPELYTFVRDRLHLLPSVLSMKKQYLRFTIKPAVSSRRNYTFTQSFQTLRNEKLYRPETTSRRSGEGEREKDWGITGLLNWFDSDKRDGRLDETSSIRHNPLARLSVGSIRTLWQGAVCSRSDSKTLRMVANLTSQYEHDYPVIRYDLSCQRPRIPSQERDDVVFRATATRAFNPSINQVLTKCSVAWGEKSDPSKKTIQIADHHTAMYKDNECFEQTAYGCKDQYGVFYPLHYNKTTFFKSENNDVVENVVRALRPIYMNGADKVLVLPIEKTFLNKSEMNMTRIYRTYDDKVDVAFTLDGMYWNMSKVFLPLEKMVEELLTFRPMYPLAEVRPVAHFIPTHELTDPFFSRDSCVVENTHVMSMDWKQFDMPKSDCEVVLIGDCARDNNQLMVSLKPRVSERTVEKKVIKAIFGASKIEIELTPGTSFTSPSNKIMINGQQMSLDARGQLLVKQQQENVSLIECSNKQCEIKSSKHGIYIRVNDQRVKLEIDNGRSRGLCGLCSAHPKLERPVANYTQSVQIFQNNRRAGEQCDVEKDLDEAGRFYEHQTCQKLFKHKMIRTLSDYRMKVCVTTEKLPLCSRHCEKTVPRFADVGMRCVEEKEADRLEILPSMEGNEMYLQDERLLTKMRSAEYKNLGASLAQSCH